MLQYSFLRCAIAIALIAGPATVRAQQAGAGSDSGYLAQVMSGAPATVVKGATIVIMHHDGTTRMVQSGTNGFTCMLLDPATPMCADKNAMDWMHAYLLHEAPPDSVGFVYMLAGDGGASNTDPYATAPASGNHWVKTGPHVMIVGPAAKNMGYPTSADPDPTKPYVMWPGTAYAHLMIPVTVQP